MRPTLNQSSKPCAKVLFTNYVSQKWGCLDPPPFLSAKIK